MHRLYELLRYVWCVISYCEPGGTTTTTIIVIRLRRLRSRVHAHDEPRRGQIFTHTPQGQLSLELIPEKNAQLAEAPPDVHDATTVSVFVFPPKNQRRLKMVALGEHVILIIRPEGVIRIGNIYYWQVWFWFLNWINAETIFRSLTGGWNVNEAWNRLWKRHFRTISARLCLQKSRESPQWF